MSKENRQITTFIFDKDLHKKAKGAAAMSGKKLSDFLDEAIREKLEREGHIVSSEREGENRKRKRK